jgi:hypothetical protein
MSFDGSGVRQLGDIRPIHGGTTWAPAGDRLAFNAFGRAAGSELNVELYEIGVDGNNLKQLTTQPPQPLLSALTTSGLSAAQQLFASHTSRTSLAESTSFAALNRVAGERLAARDYASAIGVLMLNAELFGVADPVWWIRLGSAYKDAGDKGRAEQFIRKAMSVNLSQSDRNSALALLKSLGRDPEATE